MRGNAVNTCIAGHCGVRDGVIHTGTVALMLGAALALNTAHAAAPMPAAPAAPAAPADLGTKADARMREAEERMNVAQQRMNEEHEHASRTAAEREEIEERLREAQERMNHAAAEIAAIASERASEAMERLPMLEGLMPRGPVIGVDLDPKSTGGARVRDVSPGGPAEEAGIRAGDVIVTVNGKDVKSDAPGEASRKVVQALQAVRGPRGKQSDTKLKVQVLRDGKPRDFEVTPRRIAAPFVFVPPVPPSIDIGAGPPGGFNYSYKFFGGNSDLAGLEVTTLTPQLGRYFGISKGVLVVRAPKSDTYKLQDGDVIVAIDGREPMSGSHITRILSSYQPGEQVTLRVMRDRKTQDIQVTVPDRRQSRWGGPATGAGEPM
jgi:C-terminal processing protease CtpA/Prc